MSRGGHQGNPRLGSTPYGHPPSTVAPTIPSRTPPRQPVSLQQILDEVRRVMEEERKLKEEIRRMGHEVVRIGEDCKKIYDLLKSQAESSFTIENSGYKEGLLREVGVLYASSLSRKPSNDDVKQLIMKVLRHDGANKDKFFKAKTFISNRLTDIRCEERRRLYGKANCKDFLNFTTIEFAEKFLGTIKASSASMDLYKRHLAILRKFGRELGETNDTFNKFRSWLSQKYSNGNPNNEEWKEIMDEDQSYYRGIAAGSGFVASPVGGYEEYGETGENAYGGQCDEA